MKLNLGCGTNIRPGYVNVDAQSALPGVDYVLNLANPHALLGRFLPASCDEILAHDVLEHLHHWEAVTLLADIVAVLAPGGVAEIRVPDCEVIWSLPWTTEKKLTVMFGGQDIPQGTDETMDEARKRSPEWFCHRYGWSKARLDAALQHAGFGKRTLTNDGCNVVARAFKPV